MKSDGYETRFWIVEPERNEYSSASVIEPQVLLSSRPPVRLSANGSQSNDPLLIAPWKDFELLGQAVLRAFSLVRPPFVEGLASVFDSPEPKRRNALHRAAIDGDMDALPSGSGRSKRKLDPADGSLTTPLMLGARYGHISVVRSLLELGADPHLGDKRGWLALHHGAEAGFPDVVKNLLDADSDVNAPDVLGYTALHLAAAGGHREVVEQLLVAGVSCDVFDKGSSSTPLHHAARENHPGIVALLTGSGARVDEPNQFGRTPLHVGAGYGHTEVVAALLGAGSDVNSRDHTGETPLHRPTFFQHLDCLTLLIEDGADVNAKDDLGNTPLHVAAGMNRDQAAQMLLDAGAEVDAVNGNGLTPLDIAIVNWHWDWRAADPMEYIRAQGGEHNAEVAQVLLSRGATVTPGRIPVGDRHALWPHLTLPPCSKHMETSTIPCSLS